MTAPTTTDDAPPQGDGELLTRAAHGDRAAFGQLYDRHVRPVYWQAFAIVRDADDAEDIAQDVFITTWNKLRTINLVDESALPWLLVTARFTALNARRRNLKASHGELDSNASDNGPSVEEEVEGTQVRAEISKAVAALSPTDRQLYDLCVVGDHTYELAARELGVSHAVVRNRLSRLRSRLRADLRSMRELT